MHTYHIHIQGQVQGVGFRPHVWRLAQRYALRGWVNNAADGVHIRVNAPHQTLQLFLDELLASPPPLAHITAHCAQPVDAEAFVAFDIVHSQTGTAPKLVLSPDFALCAACRRELHDPTNRRQGYAFVTCTCCGPRFSVVHTLPYDRSRTTMAPFVMCPACQAEYDQPTDRRFYSQTNSCEQCGVSLRWAQGPVQAARTTLAEARARILAGEILAVKGIGGFLLVCDATQPEAVIRLRQRKHRPDKPLAVLYPNLPTLARDVWVQPDDQVLLESPAAPIVLLPLRPEPASGLCTHLLAPGLDRLGVMLPYAPLLELLARQCARPLVATSGNSGGSPILYTDEQATQRLLPLAEAVLTHNRDIVAPQDDSVVQLGHFSRQHILLRRARGYAPTFFGQTPVDPGLSWLALGAQQKSTFTWLHQGQVYVSPYLGDLDQYDTAERCEQMLAHFQSLLQGRPQLVLADRHPDYFSTQLAARLADSWQLPLHQVQHHEAHFAAVLGEHHLLESTEPILGVVWDGTGLGHDGQIWGGEFLLTQPGGAMRRVYHLAYFDWLLANKMAREPRLSALSAAGGVRGVEQRLRPQFSATAWQLYTQMLAKGTGLQTSSMGRLFDAVAALLGVASTTSFEGQAAMQLESLARAELVRGGLPDHLAAPYPFGVEAGQAAIDHQPALDSLLADLDQGATVAQVAARWHLSLVQLIKTVAEHTQVEAIACSGGVFQNSLLIDLVIHYLGPHYQLYLHNQLAPNDECISYGQIARYSKQTIDHTIFS